MHKAIASSLLIIALAALAVVEPRAVVAAPPTDAGTPIQAPRLSCGCGSDFDCQFGAWGCPGFQCRVTAGPYQMGVCIPIDRATEELQ